MEQYKIVIDFRCEQISDQMMSARGLDLPGALGLFLLSALGLYLLSALRLYLPGPLGLYLPSAHGLYGVSLRFLQEDIDMRLLTSFGIFHKMST